MRSERDQKELDRVPNKFQRTSKQEFIKRGTLVQDYGNRYVTKNEYPHYDREDQHVIWYNGIKCKSQRGGNTFRNVVDERTSKGYHVTVHPKSHQSVKVRPHAHIYKPKTT